MQIAIVGCMGPQLRVPCQAATLYTGGYFRSCFDAAAVLVGPGNVLLLSARYGLMRPYHRVEPYQQLLSRPGSITVEQIREQARADPGIQDVTAIGLCGSRFADLISQVWADVELPLTSLGVADARRIMALLKRDKAFRVKCPRCGARYGQRCRDEHGQTAPGGLMHSARADAWRALAS